MTRSLPVLLVLKEGRALAPIWLAAVATIVATAQAGVPFAGLFAFALGAAALGVFSIGHEYAHRTLTMLLAQPLARSRLLLTKVVVLAPLLVLLSVVAAFALMRADGIDRVLGEGATGARWRLAVLILTPALGLCVAPWLTLVCRSAVGGLVFTLAVPAVLFIAAQIARAASWRISPAPGTLAIEVDPLAYAPGLTLMIVGMLAVIVVGVVHGRRLFVGLEALDAPRDLAPAVVRRSPSSDTGAITSRRDGSIRRHPLALLVQKEVRLHGLAFAVALLYAFSWIAMRLTRADEYIAGQSFEATSALYGMFLAMLVGAVASAEERALGTAEWQILQPWAYWKQWTVKVTIVCVLALILGFAVPIVLEAAFPLIGDTGHETRLFSVYWGYEDFGPLAILLIALFSFYVSTLCTGGLRALLLTLPLSFGLAVLYLRVTDATFNIAWTLFKDLYPAPLWRLMTATRDDFRMANLVQGWSNTVAFGGFVVLTLVFAFRNSRSAERGTALARRQILWVLTYVVFAGVLAHGIPAYVRWWLFTH